MTNEISFPLATTRSDRVVRRRVRGARRCWCVKVKLREQEATGGLPIFILNQWSRSGTMSEVLFRRCGIGNLNAQRPPTQTRQFLLQQQETIINDEASGPERRCLLDGGSVCAHKFSLYLGKWFQLLVSVCRGEVYLPSTKKLHFEKNSFFLNTTLTLAVLTPSDLQSRL